MWKGTKVVLLLPLKLGLYINQFIRDFFPCKFFFKKKQGDHQSLLGFQTQFSFIIYFLKLIEGSRERGGRGGGGWRRELHTMYVYTYIVCMYMVFLWFFLTTHTYISRPPTWPLNMFHLLIC